MLSQANKKQIEVAKRVLQWRWLIIDEISMVSAKLLAEVDVRLRAAVRQVGTQKCGSDMIDRPLGGLNVLRCGDFWQLDPPEGGFLADIPTHVIQAGRKYKAAPTITHGQALFWSGPANGMQGVTELVQCERCEDKWLLEVQSEFRNGNLSENNHAFLHGRPTTVPGIVIGGVATCGHSVCQDMLHCRPRNQNSGRRKATADDYMVLQNECAVCKEERRSRCRIAQSAEDLKGKCETAPAIFANNDVKYDNNKTRAQKYANDKTKL